MPSYHEAIASLSQLIPELLHTPGFNGAPPTRRKFSLNEIRHLCQALGNPQNQFPSVLIAGTNGKGSTASTLAAIASSSSLRTGLYTSPHLERVNERIQLNGSQIPDQTFADLYFEVLAAARQLVVAGTLPTLPSFFEILTALAFLYFAESRVDLAILEVGMGGRLDATNIVHPILSVITDISLDHQEFLGQTIDLIAREKAGILRPHGILVTLPQHPEANQALGEVATELHIRAISAATYMPQLHQDPIQPYPIEVQTGAIPTQVLVDSPLKGAHQHRNLALAIASAVELAQNHNFPITPASIATGIKQTHWPARLERISQPNQPNPAPEFIPEFILDVAHNPAGAWALRSALSHLGAPEPPLSLPKGLASETGVPSQSNHQSHLDSAEGVRPAGKAARCLVFACLRDKPLREMTQILFPIFDHVILAPIHSPRATDMADLLAAAQATGTPATPSTSVAEAIQLARALNPTTIVISGSLFLVGEARAILLQPTPTQAQLA